MRGIEIDPDAQTARVEAGVLVLELSEAAQKHGLCSMPGSAPDVGVTGYTLGGGLSWLGRRHGFACNRVSAIELVTADGEARTVDAESDPDLFWALRGGGGNYAIVTALHLDLLPIAELYAGALLYPAEVGAEAVRAYRDWAADVSEDVTSIVRFIRPPDLPDVPEPLRNRGLLTIDAACIGSEADGEAATAPLREIGEPIMDTFGQIPAEGLCRIHMDPEQPVPGLGHHQVIDELPDEAIAAFADLAEPDGSPLLLAELRQLGGALGRDDADGGALSALDADFVMLGIGLPMTPELGEAIGSHLDRLHEAMQPWAADGGYFNFAERPCDADAILSPDVCARLGEVKRRYDPDGIFQANHELALG
jgi:FAD/FMN-containing dehydrogenase